MLRRCVKTVTDLASLNETGSGNLLRVTSFCVSSHLDAAAAQRRHLITTPSSAHLQPEVNPSTIHSSADIQRRRVTTSTTPSAHLQPEVVTPSTSHSSAQLLNGHVAAQDIRNSIKAEISAIRETKNPDFNPGLAIVQVGDREDSNVSFSG